MKSIIQSFCFIALIFLFGCNNSDPYGNESFDEVGGVVLHGMTSPPFDKSEKLLNLLKKRLDNYTNGNYEFIDKEEGNFEVKISKSYYTSSIRDLFQVGGQLSLSQLMSKDEIEPYISSFDSLSQIDYSKNFYELVNKRGAESNSNLIGIVYPNDKDKVHEVLMMARKNKIYPPEFIWRFQRFISNGEILYFLYLVKIGEENIFKIDREQLEKIELINDPYSGGEVIRLKFNEEWTKKWKNLTTKNINKSIAITLDNQVLSAPMVRAPIENGILTLTFEDKKRIKVIASILQNEVIQDYGFKLIDADYFLAEEGKLVKIDSYGQDMKDYDFIQEKFRNNLPDIHAFVSNVTQLDPQTKLGILFDMKNIARLDIFEYAAKHNFSLQELRDVIASAKKIIAASEGKGLTEALLLDLERLQNESEN